MKKIKFNLGWVLTILWFVGIVCYFIFGDLKKPESFNELGDALAGIVAPIAFLWLILGYRQQSQQLEQNSTAINQQAVALKQQAEALNLQIEEMKESVHQQKELVVQQKEQNDRRVFEVKPYLRFHTRMYEESLKYWNYRNLDVTCIVLSLTNVGVGSARDICLYSLNKNCELFRDKRVKIDSNENAKLSFNFTKEEKKLFEENRVCEIKFMCTYNCIYGKEYRENFKLIITEVFDSNVEKWEINTQLIF